MHVLASYDRLRHSDGQDPILGRIWYRSHSEPSRTPRQYRAGCAHYRTAPPVETGVSVVHFSFCAQARVRMACISKPLDLGTHHLGSQRLLVRSNYSCPRPRLSSATASMSSGGRGHTGRTCRQLARDDPSYQLCVGVCARTWCPHVSLW